MAEVRSISNGRRRHKDENDRLMDGTFASNPLDGTVLVNPRFDRGDHAELADALLDSIEGNREKLVGVGGSLWRYDRDAGIWRERSRDALRKIVKGFAGGPKGEDGVLKVTASAVEGAITLAHAEVASVGFFDDPAPGIAFPNGFASVSDGKIVFEKHAPDHRARFGHTFDLDMKAPAVELRNLLEDVFADASEDDRSARIACIQEHVGACLVGIAPVYQKCILAVGPGGNGKSTTEEAVYRGALPDGTIATLAPQLWPERFQIARLLGALANVVDELPESELLRTGVFKSVVAGEPVHIERKHLEPFDARLRCGHVFAANALPATKDLSEGFFRRFIVIKYDRRFDNTAGCDPHKAEKVISACRPGIVAWALQGAARLQAQRGYTIPASSVEALADWKRSSDSVALFVEEQTRATEGDEIGTAASELYRRYRTWATTNGFQLVSTKTFAHRMEAAGKAMIRRNDARRYPVIAAAQEEQS